MNETLDVLGAPMIVKADGGTVAAFVADHPIPPGYFVPPHRHDADEEMLLVVEGELTLIGEMGERKVPAGASATFMRGDLHGFRNDTSMTVRLLVVATPGLQAAEMFRHFDRATREAGHSLAPAEIVAIASEYGVQFG
ncbi:MAG: cupin domain-containing protein [Reyranella sp.]|uniref:cupin domain-containing protein n=1 Tax=Reyranella sp. TaxID=1929291 RepID=UPI001218B010|nr:cupin domain-containing protein [Reyranella sp.]TAJ85371.1 MAG: cupin domain-containing protein [Reyranella sp.]TBR28844.1 MAG: cupin domain-containing protein [Reyranella sp.]